MASQIGLIEAAMKTLIEATSITHCFIAYDDSPLGSATEPYARLHIADTDEVKDDMNGYREAWHPVLIEVKAQKRETARVALDELRTVFDPAAARNALSVPTMQVIQINYEGEAQPEFQAGNNVWGQLNYRMRVRYYYGN